jgi:hypothetical protein
MKLRSMYYKHFGSKGIYNDILRPFLFDLTIKNNFSHVSNMFNEAFIGGNRVNDLVLGRLSQKTCAVRIFISKPGKH